MVRRPCLSPPLGWSPSHTYTAGKRSNSNSWCRSISALKLGLNSQFKTQMQHGNRDGKCGENQIHDCSQLRLYWFDAYICLRLRCKSNAFHKIWSFCKLYQSLVGANCIDKEKSKMLCQGMSGNAIAVPPGQW